jgi:hypothetical protein
MEGPYVTEESKTVKRITSPRYHVAALIVLLRVTW